MEHVATVESQPVGRVGAPAQTDPASRHTHGVSTLLSQRDDLRGVYAFADVVAESVRWSA